MRPPAGPQSAGHPRIKSPVEFRLLRLSKGAPIPGNSSGQRHFIAGMIDLYRTTGIAHRGDQPRRSCRHGFGTFPPARRVRIHSLAIWWGTL